MLETIVRTKRANLCLVDLKQMQPLIIPTLWENIE